MQHAPAFRLADLAGKRRRSAGRINGDADNVRVHGGEYVPNKHERQVSSVPILPVRYAHLAHRICAMPHRAASVGLGIKGGGRKSSEHLKLTLAA